MRILDLCNMYFLGLILIQGVMMITYDYSGFKYYKMKEVAKKTRIIGISAIVIAIILFILRLILC